MENLNKLEKNILDILLKLGEAYSDEILQKLMPPGAAYNSLSFALRTMEIKGILSHERVGRRYRYFLTNVSPPNKP